MTVASPALRAPAGPRLTGRETSSALCRRATVATRSGVRDASSTTTHRNGSNAVSARSSWECRSRTGMTTVSSLGSMPGTSEMSGTPRLVASRRSARCRLAASVTVRPPTGAGCDKRIAVRGEPPTRSRSASARCTPRASRTPEPVRQRHPLKPPSARTTDPLSAAPAGEQHRAIVAAISSGAISRRMPCCSASWSGVVR